MPEDKPGPVEIILPQNTNTPAFIDYVRSLAEYHAACWSGVYPIGARLTIVWQGCSDPPESE